MGRTPMRLAAAATAATLFIAGSATAVLADDGEVTPPKPETGPPGNYIVLMKDDPVASYKGGIDGLKRTQPKEGEQLDVETPEAQDYIGHLQEKQKEVAAEAGVSPVTDYQVTLNGFSAELSTEQVEKLSASKDVYGIFPDEVRHLNAQSSTDFLGLGDDRKGKGGVWQQTGGVKNAGEGVVVGIIDTGIAPEHRSFDGDRLKKQKRHKNGHKGQKGKTPYTDGTYVYFDKSDGGQFKSEMVTGQDWDKKDYSTKLIGGRYFADGAKALNYDFSGDYLSPRDGDGHGSHTGSTAAGNFGVKAKIGDVDFGRISGVAPGAKIAAYKACFVGTDTESDEDDICALSDLLAAINQAVADGVDVINYSIGGGAATSVLSTEDIAFFNAAAAGVFVSTSAGNSGPDASSADHGSPWYATVGASTIPTWEGTVRFDGFAEVGTTVSVSKSAPVTGPSIFAGDAGVAGAETPNLCLPDSLDPAKVTGHIVVCDRGSNARVQKSEVVKAAGGIGMVLVNVPGGADSLDNDLHVVPTVHLNAVHREAVLAYVQGGADRPITLQGDNTTDQATPTPQMGGFSSRGPILADGMDVLKPDMTAPGVAILAATHNGKKEKPTFGILSGTSMSSPHVAGLGALYLGEKPLATPAEVKSALMTTAYDTVKADGTPDTDPFAQGAGHVDPKRYLSPGLLYLNDKADWLAFLKGKGLYSAPDVDPIDGSDLNQASISIGTLAKPQTVTRTVTSTEAGTFTATVDVPGINATVEPSTLTFGGPGETATFTVAFENASAPAEQWATGFLTWKSETNSVRSPIALYPVTADAPANVDGTGVAGSATVELTPGVTGEIPLKLSGLAPIDLLADAANPVDGHSGNEKSGVAPADGASPEVEWEVTVPEGTEYTRFDLNSSDTEGGTDLDLYVYRLVKAGEKTYYERWVSGTETAQEKVELANPKPGTYRVVVSMYATPVPMTWDATHVNVLAGQGEGSLTATPNPLPAEKGVATSYTVNWSGLEAGKKYLGRVTYADADVHTLVSVDATQ